MNLLRKTKRASIIENKLFFEGTSKEDSIFFRQKKFELLLDDIKAIGVKFGMFLDDDYTIIIFISKRNEKYFLGYEDFDKSDISLLNDLFNINLLHSLSTRLEYEIDQFRSKTLFPIEKAGKPVFKDRSLITGLYLFFGKMFLQLHYADGLLIREVKKHPIALM